MVAEAFDNGLDPVPEPRAGQVLVHQLHLGLLAFASQPGGRQRDQRLSQGDGHGHGAPRFRHPHPIDLVKGLQVFRQRLRHDQRDVSLGCPLIFSHLAELAVALGALGLPRDGAADSTSRRCIASAAFAKSSGPPP